MNSNRPRIVELDFAKIELFDDHVISTIAEGVSFTQPHLNAITELFESHYGDRPFVSIANRENDYTIDPTCLMKQIPNLIGIGVVTYNEASFQTAHFEKQFYPGLLEIFNDMDECMTWAQSLLLKNK